MLKMQANHFPNRTIQPAQIGHHHKSRDHRNQIASIVASSFCKQPHDEHAQQRSVSIAENAQNDRQDAQLRVMQTDIRSSQRDSDQKKRKQRRANPHRAHFPALIGGLTEPPEVKIAHIARRQGIQRRAERPHRGGQNPGNHQPAQPRRHDRQDEMRKHLVRKHHALFIPWQQRIGIGLVVNAQQDSDGQHGEHHGNVRQT